MRLESEQTETIYILLRNVYDDVNRNEEGISRERKE
jgi:hypothetical protein